MAEALAQRFNATRGAIPWPGLRQMIRLGMSSLWRHRLRSLLTVLGIVFGVASVIAMLAVGEGASFEAQEQIRRLGSKNIIVRSLRPSGESRNSSQRSYVIQYGLTYEDLERIEKTLPSVRVVVPGRIIRRDVWNATRRSDSEVVGTLPSLYAMRRFKLLAGRYLTWRDLEFQRNVCVISAPLATTLFPMQAVLGSKVRVDSDYYEVIGIVEHEAPAPNVQPSSASSVGETAPSASLPRMYIPLTAAKARFGEILMKRASGSFSAERVQLHEATIQVGHEGDVEESAHVIEDLLSRNHKRRDFETVVPLELLRQAERTKQIFNIVLGSIAAISLLVGGIGIMNIMLASVTERTREIGIRRALGARRRDIVLQFLVETVLLSGAGGLIGVALGLVIPALITYFAGMPTIVRPWSPVLAFSISAAVGIIFGLYPGRRAAHLDPVVALRHE